MMTLTCKQYDKATLTELALRSTCKANCNNGNLVQFLDQPKVICYKSNDGGLSYKTYKIIVTIKPLYNFINSKPKNPHGYKEEV